MNKIDDFVVPKLRENIKINIVDENQQRVYILNDPYNYSPQPIAIQEFFYKILEFCDGKRTFNEVIKLAEAYFKTEINIDIVINAIKFLNDNYFLESPNYYLIKYQIDSYLSLKDRPPVCAGSSYPYDALDLEIKLEQILNSYGKDEIQTNAKFLIVPHIDFNIGKISHEVYSAAYKAILNYHPDLIVIFGTSHYISSDLFMLTQKNFKTPLGIAQVDLKLIEQLKEELDMDLTIDELAHKDEHSIEFQVVLLQYLYKNDNIKILPVLVGSFHEFLVKKKQPNKSHRFNHFITSLKTVIDRNYKKPLIIASGDLAHVGRKFQDNFDASTVLEQLKREDMQLIDRLSRKDSEGFFDLILNTNDKRKICGLSPFYTLLEYQKLYNDKVFKGEFLKYNQWNEIETRSAVTFTSIAYYQYS